MLPCGGEAADEDWAVLKSFFPDNWGELAVSAGALKGLRKNKLAVVIHFVKLFCVQERPDWPIFLTSRY